MKLVTAIEKAVMRGWNPHNEPLEHYLYGGHCPSLYETVLDPLFWAALGRSEGWKRQFVIYSEGTLGYDEVEEDWKFDGIAEDDNSMGKSIPEYLYRMHRLIDTLATASSLPDFDMQRSIEVFFEGL